MTQANKMMTSMMVVLVCGGIALGQAVVETANGEKDFVENAWIGQILAIGDSVRLSVTGPCPRCVMTTLPQGDLPRDPCILRTAAQHNRANVGVYASVLQGGRVRRGDSLRLE